MKKLFYSFIFLTFIFLNLNLAKGKTPERKDIKKYSLQKTTLDTTDESVININNITSWVANNGFHNWVVAKAWNSEFPKGKKIGTIFSEGIVWGGKVTDGNAPLVRVNGNTYGTGCKAITKVFRVRPDYKTGNLFDDAASFFKKDKKHVTDAEIEELREEYEKDWNEWPAENGAPYEDINKNGVYEPDVDIPGVPGAAQTLFIKYDDSMSLKNYGSPPIGLEISETYWAYSTFPKLNNVIYKKVDIVYKGTDSSAVNSKIDSMFIAQWADPDVGSARDDFAGCDTLLNLGFAYQPEMDATYEGIGYPFATAGYSFLQGVSQYTGNSSDSAMFNFKWRKGYKYVNPKPMSNFIYFAAGGRWNDPSFSYDGTLEFYNLMRGKLPIPRYPSGESFPENVSTETPFGTFLLDGDPVNRTGKIDGNLESFGDRRILLSNGPFSLSIGDTAEVLIALIATESKNKTTSIQALKTISGFVQQSFDTQFKNQNLPIPSAPNISFNEDGDDIILEWEQNNEIESFNKKGYKFQGYNIYQISSEKTVLLKTFDTIDGINSITQPVYDPLQNKYVDKIIQFGSDNGLKYSYKIKKDYINDSKLLKGKTYYFAVTSYTYNPDTVEIKTTETPVSIKKIIYRKDEEGLKYGDLLTVKQIAGEQDSSKKIIVSVFDADSITGEKYRISFFYNYNDILWKMTNENDTAVLDSMYQMKNENEYVVVDGLRISVIGDKPGVKDWSSNGKRWVSGVNWRGKIFFGSIDIGQKFFGSNVGDNDYVDVKLEWAGVTNRGDESAATLANNSKSEYPERWSKGAVYRRDLGYQYDGTADIPFVAYDVKSVPERRLNIVIVEDQDNGSANKLWDMGWTGETFAASGGREYIFIMHSDYDEGSIYDDSNLGYMADVLYAFWPKNRENYPYLDSLFTFNIYAAKHFTQDDIFEIKSDELLEINKNKNLPFELKLYQNYPNPFNPTTTIKYTIPIEKTLHATSQQVQLKIYDVLGREVVTLVNEKQKPGNYQVTFNGGKLSSGVYFYKLQYGEYNQIRKMLLLK